MKTSKLAISGLLVLTKLEESTYNLTLGQSVPFVGTLLKMHLEEVPDSRVRERRNIFTAFCDSFSHQKVSQLTPSNLKAWFFELREKNNYSDRNLNHIKSDLNHFFKFLVKNDYLPRNPLNEVKFSRRYTLKRDRVILFHSEIMAALEAMKVQSPTVVYPFIFTLVHTGARREEVKILKWENINFETGYLTFGNTRNGADRSICMKSSLSLPRISEWVFMNQFGWLLSREQIDDTIAAVQKKSPEMKPWRCHDPRHSFAFNFLKRGGDMYTLKAILGHKTIQLTVDLYGNFTAEHVQNVSPYD